MAEAGGSSGEWEHGGRVFVPLGGLMPGGGDSPGLRDRWQGGMMEHSVWVVATTRLEKMV